MARKVASRPKPRITREPKPNPIPVSLLDVVDALGTTTARELVKELDSRTIGRPGYPAKTMVTVAVVKVLGRVSWVEAVRRMRENPGLRQMVDAVPSIDACYRFERKVGKERLSGIGD